MRCLLRILGAKIKRGKMARIKKELPVWRREANKRRPPKQQAAEAIRLQELRRIIRRARKEQLTYSEKQALDILVVAFATMSRVGEVATLEVENVSRDGETISVRPKTGAKTWRRLVKKVANTAGLQAATKLEKYREEAIQGGRRCLFVGAGGEPPTTSAITSHLKKLGRKLGSRTRLTAHSARKGAAVEAVLSGVPLPVIQALGGWSDVNTLQAYIGEAIRRSISVEEVITGRANGERDSRIAENLWRGRSPR